MLCAGGVVGVLVTAIMAQHSWGLDKADIRTQESADLCLVPEAPLSHSASGRRRRLTKTSSLEDVQSPKPKLERRASIQVATLTMEPHVERTCSFESSPGDFYHEEWGRRVTSHLHFPITYDPSGFSKRMVTRGTQVESMSFDEVRLFC